MKMELCASRLHVGRHEWTLIRVLHLHCCCLVDDPLLELTHLQTAATHCRSGRFTKTEGDFMFFFPVNPVIDCVPLLSMYLLSIYDRWDRFQPSCNPEWGTHEWMDGFSICNKGVFVPYFMSWFHQSKKKTATSLKLGKIVDCWVITLQIVVANIWLPRGCSTVQPLLSVWLKMITHWRLSAQLAWWEATCPKKSRSNLDHKLEHASHTLIAKCLLGSFCC